jgi:hypothetical protein
MNTADDRQGAGHSNDQHHERPGGAESPRHLLAVHDPSKQATARGRQAAGRGYGVTVQWVRPTDLAARMAARASAGAVAAHVSAHRQVRESVRARLAPLSAFGRDADGGPVRVERSVIGR